MIQSHGCKESSSDVTVIMISYNTASLLPKAINDLQKSAFELSLQTIIIDNASRDDSVDLIKCDYSDWTLIENKTNVGFGRANNQALPLISGRYVLLLNTDAFVSADTLGKTVSYMDEHPKCGLLGVKLVGRDGEMQPSCRYFPTPLNIFLNRTGLNRLFPWVDLVDDLDWDHASVRACDWVPGCYLLIRREVIDQVGLFDERYFLYSEEVDLCFAVKKTGWQVHYYPDTTVVHLGGESAKFDHEITDGGKQVEKLQIESELLYFRKNHGIVAVITHLLLTTLGNMILLFKRLIQGRFPLGWKVFGKHTLMYWKLANATKLGSLPTK